MPIIEERGFFWPNEVPIQSPDSVPDKAAAGTLRIEEDRIRLELDDSLRRSASRLPRRNAQIIQGALRSGARALLMDAFYAGGSLGVGVLTPETYQMTSCLIRSGRAFPSSMEPPSISAMSVSLEGLDDWVRLGGLQIEGRYLDLKLSYNRPDEISYALEDSFVRIASNLRGSAAGRHSDVHFREWAVLEEIFKHELSIGEVTDRYRRLCDFFIILTGSEFPPHFPTVRLACDDVEDDACYLYFYRESSDAPSPRRFESLTNLQQLKQDWPAIHQQWLTSRNKYGPAFYMYTATRRGRKLYSEHEFVSLAWGLERFHEEKHGSRIQPRLAAKIDRILSKVDGRDRRWLENVLAQAQRPSLGDRIFDLFKTLPIPLNLDELARFAQECGKLRNELSHFGSRRSSDSDNASVPYISYKAMTLQALYHLLIMNEIGIGDAVIKDALMAPQSYSMRFALGRENLLIGHSF